MTNKIRQRPEILQGMTYKAKTGCGNIYITINDFEGKPFEIFAQLGKAGDCSGVMLGTVCVAISKALRAENPISIETFMNSFEYVRCPKAISITDTSGKFRSLSCVDAMAQIIYRHVNKVDYKEPGESILPVCPKCNMQTLVLYDAVNEQYDIECANCHAKFASGKDLGGK